MLKADNSALARDCRSDIKTATQQLQRLGPRERNKRRELRAQLRGLAKEERQRQSAAVKEVIGGAHVLCATLTGALSYNLKVGRAGLGEVGGRPRGGQGEAWAGQDKAGPGLGGPRGWVGAL